MTWVLADGAVIGRRLRVTEVDQNPITHQILRVHAACFIVSAVTRRISGRTSSNVASLRMTSRSTCTSLRSRRTAARCRRRTLQKLGLGQYAQRSRVLAGSRASPASPIAAQSTRSSATPASAPTRAQSPSPRRPRRHPASTPRRSRSAQGGNQRASAARRR